MTWRAEYDIETFVISVNLSGKQLQREDVVERVADILERTGIPPQCLKLEITESVLMADMEDAIAKMRLLKKLGIKLALDDFGTGYSSLSSLSDFPIDTVKIDRAFIKRLGEQDDASSVVEAITLLSRSMSMDVTCEGVETQSQVAHIQGFGCHTGQGYFFASPLTSSEFGARLMDGKLANLAESDKSMEEMIERMLNELPHSPNRLAA
jgi:EAL domain-containing protein (putative c-di-GMP-specific phosphodiesterase class I)